jgi:hypothetical protein
MGAGGFAASQYGDSEGLMVPLTGVRGPLPLGYWTFGGDEQAHNANTAAQSGSLINI